MLCNMLFPTVYSPTRFALGSSIKLDDATIMILSRVLATQSTTPRMSSY